MPTQFRARQLRAKTNEVVEYHRDEARPGKPLYLLIPGGLIALASLALIIYIAYRIWYEASMGQSSGLPLIGLLSPFYVGGVFMFSYGYELYNLPRALRLTGIIVFITVAAVVIVAVPFLLLSESKGGSSSSSSSSKSSSGSSKSASPSRSSGLGAGVIGTAGKASASRGSSGSSHSSYSSSDVFISSSGGTRVETREVTKEVVKEVPREPMPITCPFCGRSYTPAKTNFICPSCGAATPKSLIAESQMPKAET